MMLVTRLAAGIAALGLAAAPAQMIAPGYHMERQFFHVGPVGSAGSGREAVHAPDQNVPSFTGEAHVPSNSVQGRGAEPVETGIVDR